jgi:hypothetical protein
MNPIEFVSAGAGSGKTYRLTSIIADALSSGSARASLSTASMWRRSISAPAACACPTGSPQPGRVLWLPSAVA